MKDITVKVIFAVIAVQALVDIWCAYHIVDIIRHMGG